jgi:uncharacterized repeat protein (TIGR01451 family)
VSETQSTPRIITRGTVDPADDVSVLPGQAWVTVASPVEGSSYVTAFAPDIQGVISNRQSAVIHWVDVRWLAPRSSTAGLGESLPLITSVTRASTGAPLAGYKVRYEVAGGVAAGFGPSQSGGVELTTNDQGQAAADLVQSAPQPGVAQVNIRLIRPAGIVPGVTESLVVGSSTISVNWTDGSSGSIVLPGPSADSALPGAPVISPGAQAPAVPAPQTTPPTARPGLDLRIVSPAQSVSVGDQAEFQIHITNRTSAALRNVMVLDRFGSGLEHAVAPSPIKRSIGDLATGQTQSIGLTFTVREPGRQCHTVEVTADGGVRVTAEGCVTATGAAAEAPARTSIALQKTGPQQMKLGDVALFKIEVTNTGDKPLAGLRVTDAWRGGLQPVRATDGNQRLGANELVWQHRAPLAPGEKAVFEVEYRAAAAQQDTCSRAAVSGEGVTAEDEICVEISGAPAAEAQSKLSVLVSDRTDPVPVGTAFSYRIVVRNDGTTPQRDVVLSVELPESLTIEQVQAPVKESKLLERPIRFAPILLLESGKLVSYELRVKAAQPGKVVVRASATSQTVAQPSTAEQDTTILSQ